MNISQHCFVPTGTFYLNKYYNASGNWADVNQQSQGKVASSLFQPLPDGTECNLVFTFCKPSDVGATQSVGKLKLENDSIYNIVNQAVLNGYGIVPAMKEFQSVSALPGLMQVVMLVLQVPFSGVVLSNMTVQPIDTELV